MSHPTQSEFVEVHYHQAIDQDEERIDEFEVHRNLSMQQFTIVRMMLYFYHLSNMILGSYMRE